MNSEHEREETIYEVEFTDEGRFFSYKTYAENSKEAKKIVLKHHHAISEEGIDHITSRKINAKKSDLK